MITATDSDPGNRSQKETFGPLVATPPEEGLSRLVTFGHVPARYVLENVATDEGVVIVSNVNCGYLDMSANFLLSVREASGAKVRMLRFSVRPFNAAAACHARCCGFPLVYETY